MTAYLVEVHATFHDPSADQLETVQGRLAEMDDVLADPPPAVLTPEGEDHAVLQFAIEAKNEVKADSTGRDLAETALSGVEDGDSLADVALVSARTLGEPETV
ncbi:hypothetical protein GCM10027446_11360 [Angustibacter peucedani]